MVLLSGQSWWRSRKAAQLFREKYAPRILVYGGGIDEYFAALTDERAYDAELIGRVLVRFGVPKEALVLVNGVTSTRDEAAAFREYVRTHSTQSAILVTSHLHSRRARWAFRRALAGLSTEVIMVEADQPDIRVHDWWQNPDASLGLLNEYLKFGYYVLHN